MNRLYHYPLSPFSRKVRLSLAEKRIEVELVEERFWEQDADFLRRNPAGKVPVLKMVARFVNIWKRCTRRRRYCQAMRTVDMKCAVWWRGLTINSIPK
jgi:glutathione S-transferase